MHWEILQSYNRLINAVTAMPEVMSVGKSGGAALPEEGEGDIDIFIFCDVVPSDEKRFSAVKSLGDCTTDMHVGSSSSKHWGICDYILFGRTEVCLMYYSISDMNKEIEATLSGARPTKEDNYFYPTGRCASFLDMHILCDKQGYIAEMKEKVNTYPDALRIHLIRYHLELLADVEDLERAVCRKDVLFYHFALDLSLDHFFQALFALNRCYFPSRKRSLMLIETFPHKPVQCAVRLLRIIALGAHSESIMNSYSEFLSLSRELSTISSAHMTTKI